MASRGLVSLVPRASRSLATLSSPSALGRTTFLAGVPAQSMYVRQMASVATAVNSRATGMLAALVGAGTLATAIATMNTGECEAPAAQVGVLQDELPDGLKPVASISEFNVVLYQYQPCPFCNKVRAFLDYHKIPYKTVEVNPLFKGELKFTDYKKVPLAVIQGVQVKESANIINVLAAMLPLSSAPATPTTTTTTSTTKSSSWWWPFSSSSSSTTATTSTPNTTAATKAQDTQRWCKWADDVLVHLLPANIYRTPTEALHSFDYLLEHGNFPPMQRDLARYVGAAAMHLLSKYKLNKKYGITQPREQLYLAVEDWVAAVADGPFHGGAQPDLADLTIFGVLRSIEGYDVFAEMVANTHVHEWYARMAAAVGAPSRVDA